MCPWTRSPGPKPSASTSVESTVTSMVPFGSGMVFLLRVVNPFVFALVDVRFPGVLRHIPDAADRLPPPHAPLTPAVTEVGQEVGRAGPPLEVASPAADVLVGVPLDVGLVDDLPGLRWHHEGADRGEDVVGGEAGEPCRFVRR